MNESKVDVSDADSVIQWTSQCLNLLGYDESTYDRVAGSAAIASFVSGTGPKTLAVVGTATGVRLSCEEDILKGLELKHLKAYLLRSSRSYLTRESIAKEVQYGTVGGKGLTLSAFTRLMKGLVEKHVSHNTDLSGHYHRCMATLTDTVHSTDGSTMLYCPEFDFTSASEAAADKEHMQIMESVVIHWTSQIKDVINNHDSSASAETSGPLDEIEFWKGRAKNLLGIQHQLEKGNVRRIVEVLEYAKSNYIGPFHTLTQQIVAKAAEANDNLKYLESIRDHCTALHTIAADKIVTILPELLNRVRLLWSFSKFYNDNDSISGLLRKVSNEIISRFRSHVPVRDILDGDVEFCISRLLDAIHCGMQWKIMYHKMTSSIVRQKARYGRVLDIEDASIFAQIDAFVQRCRDLIEVCESQMQFVRKSSETKGSAGPVPQFGGTKAQEIVDGITGIQASFEIHVERLRNLDYDFLDVRVSKWHDDYHHFKNTVKDLEVMFTNVINGAFENATTVMDSVSLTETFFWLAKRDAVKRSVEKKALETMRKLGAQMNTARSEFELSRSNPPLRIHEPQYAGSALWAHSLYAVVEEGYKSLNSIIHVLNPRDFADFKEQHETFCTAIKGFKLSRYNIWLDHLSEKAKDNGLQARLDKNIMKRVDASQKNSELICNFDEELLMLFSEVSYWEKFQGEFSIPYVAHDLCNKRDSLRIMREMVMLVVRSYNEIVRDIDAEHRRLFVDHMRKLDRRMNQGLNKLTWQSKNMIDMYVRDCVVACEEVHIVVKEFKDWKASIARMCKQVMNLLCIKIEKSQIYEGGLFERKQEAHREIIMKQLEGFYNSIVSTCRSIYQNFKDGTAEVKREWRNQITQMDKQMEQSLKLAVKRSLQELSKAINGDSKSDPQTLFTVQIILDANRVTFMPSMVNLTHSVNIVAKDIIGIVNVVPRIKSQNFGAEASALPEANVSFQADGAAVADATAAAAPKAEEDKLKSYYEIISDDNDILRIVVQIMNGMSSSATELQKYLSYWDKYKALWEMDKDMYIRKYSRANRPPSQFDVDVSRYRTQQGEIISETSTHIINFVRVDCNAMKDSLVGHCLQCQTKLTNLLNDNGAEKLKSIFKLFVDSRNNLTVPPKDLDELDAKVKTCKDLKDNTDEVTDMFDPAREIYNTLVKFDVVVKDDELDMLATLDEAFDGHKSVLFDAEKMLDRYKVTMKRELEQQLDAYSSQMEDLREASKTELPYSSDKPVEEALQVIEAYKSKAAKASARQSALATGLAVFGASSHEHKDLMALSKDLDFLEQIWNITIEWSAQWETWKTGLFSELNIDDLDTVAGNFMKRVGKLGRDIKKWKVWDNMKGELDKFRETVPLIADLRNKAMRSRHWAALQERIGKEFNPNSPEFTLNEVVKLGLNEHAEFIGELSSNANKELAIEVALKDLEKRWEDVELDVGTYKEKYYKFRSTEDISQFLEDDSVALSTMKASKFYASFQSKIDAWERTLASISEVIEASLDVQRKWIYLESIFMSGGDISKQLPKEHSLFIDVNNSFSKIMENFANHPNAMKTCTEEGLLASIMKMDENLEKIQKSLNQYLETKRQVFPRFYFVSDDDLLEILGQSKDPVAVQKHIKKCFEGIQNLKLNPPGGSSRIFEAVLMNSPDGESAPFVDLVPIDGPVELWLVLVEKSMKRAISKLLLQAIPSFKSGKKEDWVKKTIGQLIITTGSIMWTTDCTRALVAIANGSKGALKAQKKKQVSYLSKLTAMVRGPLTPVERNKVVALITMEIHNRDVMEKMVKSNCASVQDFEWLSQLRFVFVKEGAEFGKCECRQTNSVLEYSYEYQGNNGRLVVTPLTDRCVLTLITAMYLNRGGNPLGPAGTGKTETVKDLGKNLAKYVVVMNCSDGMDYKSVGRIFSGLVQSGSWGCFDEFNRIKIEVISVVAMQISDILSALTQKLPSFTFMGVHIKCNLNCGVFITMNPGYAGRTELPDNLKALMRPVAMMAPDLTMIAEVMLASEGFNEGRIMAKKTVTLYSLMVQQLSKQYHYDYGLRNLKAVLNMAGQLKRADANMPEESILMRALRDMNLPKFIKDDERLFRLLLGDLFPNLELPTSVFGALGDAVNVELDKAGLQRQEFLIGKIFQFYDSRMTRHCNMLVGDPMGGKSTAWKILAAAQTTLNKNGNESYLAVTPYILSPKSIELDELYGAYDLATFEWKDGILSTIFKAASQDERQFEKWILFDGPVDTTWIESMNSVMDDNRILTLINGDRIQLTQTMSLVFETQDLSVASPATVSRAGMIYIDAAELGWRTFVQSWLDLKFAADAESKAMHKELFEKWLPKVLRYKLISLKEPVEQPDFVAVKNLCNLYDSLEKQEPSYSKEKLGGDYASVVEKFFVYCLIWSVGATLDEDGRKKMSTCLADIDSIMPAAGTVFDYFLDIPKNEFTEWSSKVPNWRATGSMTFHDMIVPTVDTMRNGFMLDVLVKNKQYVMLVGATGTGKTVLAQTLLGSLPETHSKLVINFSAATTSGITQEILESPMEKRSKDKLGPQGGKQMVVFIDDFNMPKKVSLDSPFQPALELVRLWLDYKGWYDRVKCFWKYVLDTQIVVAMGHPGGGRNHISGRTQSRFSLFNCTNPADSQIVRIFESILSSKLVDFEKEILQLSGGIAVATLNVYKSVSQEFLATPEKFHYVFNLRDVAKVIQGVLMGKRSTIYTPESMLRLWVHELQRVFSDRLIRTKSNDEVKFREIVAAKMNETFQKDWQTIMSDALNPIVGPLFCTFLQEATDEEGIIHEEVTDYPRLRVIVEEKLEDYNMEPKLLSMDLAMFIDAIMHVCRICRILSQARGNMMLVGVGGSGRSSLARLSSYISNMSVFTIEITKNYRMIEFREDIKKLYLQAGVDNQNVVFLFNDTQIKDEGFLEDINNILSSGTVPNLFPKEDLPGILDGVRKAAVKAGCDETTDALWSFFIDRVRANLHVLLACSPIGDSLRDRCRMYPGLVNCTTINWFHIWPAEALQEVAMKFLASVEFDHEEYRAGIASVFADMHLSVINSSDRMLLELKRHNYVTPTNYLELVKGYRLMLAKKSSELSGAANKLANGLAKLEDAKEQVEVLSKELEIKKVVVAKSQKSCEDLLVQIVSDRRTADEQKKQVEADSERISVEAAECKAISDDAEADLAVAMPALEKAMEEVDKLDKGSVSEVKAYSKPPPLVETVLQAVMILMGKPTDWASAKTALGASNFLTLIKAYDKDNVSPSTNNKIKKYVENPEFSAEAVKKVSGAAAALCIWVHAIYLYANVAKEVAPKRQKLKEATDTLIVKQAALKEAQDALTAILAKLEELQVMYDKSVGEKNDLIATADMLEKKLDRADKLVKGLEGEYVRWQVSIGILNDNLVKVTGDALVAAAFVSYAGPFESSYRAILMKEWAKSVDAQKLPITNNFSLTTFLANPTDVRDWQIQGLPRDDFSTENGLISTAGSRWPLMIDPQGQANRWIRNMEGKELRIIDLKMTGFLRDVENAVQYGFPVLLQDILEEMDPAMEPVLSKSVLKIGNREVMRIGDKELDYSPDFRLYITTKLANPHYTPEISTKACVVNFAVKKDGLEAQLLGIVVQKEEPTLETQKSELTIRVAKGKRQLVDLENEILRLLSETKGSLLDDADLVDTLQSSKVTSEEVTEQLKVAEETEKKIDAARLGYRPAAIRASLAFFILDDMARVDPMYQFSLDSYVELFNASIDSSRINNVDIQVSTRCDNINNYHTLSVYKSTCRGLFEEHKLLFSLSLCLKIMESKGLIVQDEFEFFSIGAGIIDRGVQPGNPASDWLPLSAWDNVTEMDKNCAGLSGIVSAFQQNGRDWKAWYLSAKPEVESMPGDWSNKTELQKLCIIRGLRLDRALFSMAKFVTANIGPEYVDPPSFDLKLVHETSHAKAPLIFVLSPGVDPTAGIVQLARLLDINFSQVALGQGQAPTAVRLIEEALKGNSWVFLANCHLMLSWMPTLEKMIESHLVEGSPPKNFRLWLSSSPTTEFPISILQRGIKMTTEPPKGLRSNLMTLFNTISEEQFARCSLQFIYKKLLFALVWFHAILLERRKFKSLGFNLPYDFNESDFAICHDLIIVFLDEYPDRVPFEAMKYLIAEANYGGRVTDDWDRRTVNVYIGELFCDELVNTDRYPLSELPEYFIPEDGDLKFYKEAIRALPQTDHPMAFGQHSNSDMAASMLDSTSLLSTLTSLQPRKVQNVDENAENPLAAQCQDLLEQTAFPFNMRETREKIEPRSDPDPLKTVLYQELDRYNALISKIRSNLSTIIKLTQGTASTSAELEEVMEALSILKVPRLWGKTYPSLKPLGAWIVDLQRRVDFYTAWIDHAMPTCWWLPALTYPTGFLTAILQVAARMNGVSIDGLSYDTPVLNTADTTTVTAYPKDGVYVSGIFLEGATWNYAGGFLEESRPMELLSNMPIVHFKPTEGKKKTSKGMYVCPLYMYPVRSGTRERPSFVYSVEIRGGRFSSDFWTKRGVALLLSHAA